MSAIILYFSRADENYVSGSIRSLTVGNTETAANLLGRLTGAPLFKIEPLAPYSPIYSQCVEEAKRDQNEDARPALAALPEDLDLYDTVYLGFPNYWGTMPMPVFTLLEQCDFSQKTILPFCTHEGSGMGRSVQDIKRLCPKALVGSGLALLGSNAAGAEKELKKWIAASQTLAKL